MKKILTRNIGLKILSIVLAAFLWLLITNIDNPVKSQLFSNVPVRILNENAIDVPNQIYEVIAGEKVTFRVAARRSILEQLTVDDFRVTADFSKLLNGNTVMIDIVPRRFANEVSIVDGKYQTLTIGLEELAEEDFRVNVIPIGTVAEGFHIGEKTASPNIIRVSGPKGRIDKIKEVVAEVDVDKARADRPYIKISEPKALGEDGKEIDSSKLTFSSRYIEVNINLYKTKLVDLIVKTEGEPAPGYVVTGIEFEPKTVKVAAASEILNNLHTITLYQDIDGATKDVAQDIDLSLHLDQGVILVEDNRSVGINIKIEKLETKEIIIWPNDIEMRNRREILTPILHTVGPIRIQVTGLKKDIDSLSRDTLKPYIDLTDRGIGTYSLPIQVNLAEFARISETMISLSLNP